MQSAAEFLASVPIFTGLATELREEIASRAQRVEVPAGQWLFRQGQPGDALYVILSGRLEVLTETDGRLLPIRELSRGAAFGELALLTDDPRSASVRALRDSELLVVNRETFVELLRSEPEFAIGLTLAMGRQLQANQGLFGRRRALPSTVAIVGLDPGAPVEAVRQTLQSELAAHASVAYLSGAEAELQETDDGSGGAFSGALDRLEREHRHVLLTSGAPETGQPWSQFCLRQADRAVCVASGPPPAWLTGSGGPDHVATARAALQGCELVVALERGPHQGGRAVLAGEWRAAVSPRSVRMTGATPGRADLSRLARRIGGRALGAVLSGGGARGFAHIGALEALSQAGLEIDRIAGCSMGAYVGAQFSAGVSPAEIRDRCHTEFVAGNPLNDYTFPLAALVRGRKARDMLTRTYADDLIELLDRDYFCVSCDLVRAELIVHRSGPIGQAVGASMCLPGIAPPVAVGEKLLVDGGVFNNLPVEEMASSDEGPVLAIDVTAHFQTPGARPSRFRRRRPRELAARAHQVVTGWDVPLPSLKETIIRSIVLGSIDTGAAAAEHADALIAPEVEQFGLLDFGALDQIAAAGRRAATEALESGVLEELAVA